VAYSIRFSEEKNELLKATREVCFDDLIKALKKGDLLADITHPSVKRYHQRIYVIQIKLYAYAVPYILNDDKQEIFLKTIYPSRVLTHKYLGGKK